MPEAYGTEQIFLTARDPHWLYAAWDLTAAQRNAYNGRSKQGHLVVRVYFNEPSGPPATEIHVHPESKSWFIHVPRGETRYTAELGYYDRSEQWQVVAASASTLTPPESVSQETTVNFATIPPEVSLKKLFEVVQEAVSEHVPLIEAVQQLRADGWADLPQIVPASAPEWTPTQAHALAEVVRLDESRRVWMGSMEITELVRRHLQHEVSSQAVPEGLSAGPSPTLGQIPGLMAAAGISSPTEALGGPGGRRSFWLSVNAELVLYGSTEADAKVTIGGREIRLRPDGTFSYRFSLPDGQYPLTLTARSADGVEERSAKLRFERSTQREGQVGAHSQDATLKSPLAAHVA